MNVRNIVYVVSLLILLGACKKEKTLSGLNIRDFQTEVNGQLTNLFVLRNENGMEACITNYGARLVSLMVPDKEGKLYNVVCGFATIQDYMKSGQNFGATIGRYTGRILNSSFVIDSVTNQLTPKVGSNDERGEDLGFATRIWQGEQLEVDAVKMTLFSLDGENGFPGNLGVTVIYRLNLLNELDITYEATTDKTTVVNLSNHIHFNLSGDFNTTIEDYNLYIDADKYISNDSSKYVAGEMSVVGTPYDFLIKEHSISKLINEDTMKGYDCSWVLNKKRDKTQNVASLKYPKSGRLLTVCTDEPGLQVHIANKLGKGMAGKDGRIHRKQNGIYLKVLRFPNGPDKPQFPSTILHPGEIYQSHSVYRFKL